jgi:hypothetical protein
MYANLIAQEIFDATQSEKLLEDWSAKTSECGNAAHSEKIKFVNTI